MGCNCEIIISKGKKREDTTKKKNYRKTGCILQENIKITMRHYLYYRKRREKEKQKMEIMKINYILFLL